MHLKNRGKTLSPSQTFRLVCGFTWKQKDLESPTPGSPALGGGKGLRWPEIWEQEVDTSVYTKTMYPCTKLNTVNQTIAALRNTTQPQLHYRHGTAYYLPL